jgi:EAL domain-containing protein (putative c-di-GMP-specific phosphodiesterase class I)/ActR/RegA family two-component response regulator
MLIAAAENLISYVVLLAEFKFPKEFGARFGAQRKTSDAWSRTMSSFAPIYIANDTSTVDPESNSRGTNASLISAFQSAVGLQFLTDAMEAKVRTLAMLGTELRKAIASSQLFLVYQPEIDVDTRQIVSVEALVRWCHPVRGTVSSDEFMAAAEMCGLIAALEHWVLHEAFRQMKEWVDASIAPSLIAMNVSGRLKKPLKLEHDVTAILSETALPPRFVELQLAESVLSEASQEHNDVLQKLRGAGLQITFNDFGSGLSSLEYLARFPIDRVKIGQTFMHDLKSGSGGTTITKAAIGLAQDLGLDVIVEGVETMEQLELVRSWSGRKVKGHYFSKPLPAGEVDEVLRGKLSFFPHARQKVFRVLHIDDDSDTLDVVAASLGLDPEFVVRDCRSGADGLAVAAEWRPDVILLDVMMPVMDGPSTLRHLREAPRTADIPVVFMTARAQTSEIEHFKSLGTAGVITKPFDPMKLAASVRNYVQPANIA